MVYLTLQQSLVPLSLRNALALLQAALHALAAQAEVACLAATAVTSKMAPASSEPQQHALQNAARLQYPWTLVEVRNGPAEIQC